MNYNFSSIKVLPMQLSMFSKGKGWPIQILYSDHSALTLCRPDPSPVLVHFIDVKNVFYVYF